MRNAGALRATGRWLFFKDADCDVDVDKIEEICLLIEAENQGLKVIGGRYQSEPVGILGRVYDYIQRLWLLNGMEPGRIGRFRQAKKLLGGALLIERRTFCHLEGFSEAIGWGGEELEFLQRVHKQNLETAVSFQLCVRHEKNMSWWGFLRRAWKQNFNPGYFAFRRHQPGRSGLQYFRGPWRYWPALIVFLGVGTCAHTCGVLGRQWRKVWS
jgi:hypothetical protein